MTNLGCNCAVSNCSDAMSVLCWLEKPQASALKSAERSTSHWLVTIRQHPPCFSHVQWSAPLKTTFNAIKLIVFLYHVESTRFSYGVGLFIGLDHLRQSSTRTNCGRAEWYLRHGVQSIGPRKRYRTLQQAVSKTLPPSRTAIKPAGYP